MRNEYVSTHTHQIHTHTHLAIYIYITHILTHTPIHLTHRWLGIRPKSGRWHRKDGRFGRKIKPIKKMITFTSMKTQQSNVYRMHS